MTSSPYGPYELGYTRVTMVRTIKKQFCKKKQIYKSYLSSNCGLKLVHMKLESLVIVNQHVTVNMYLDPAHTARHMPEVSFT